MDRIYSQARKVRIWLGPATDEGFNTTGPSFGFSRWNYKDARQVHGIDRTHIGYLAANTTSFRQSVEDLLSRAWFTRRWVLQEVAFARVPIVHCGHHEAPWKQFYQGAAGYLCYHATGKLEHADSRISGTVMRALGLISHLSDTREYTNPGLSGTVYSDSVAFANMLGLLKRYHRANCTDERDRLYALYGMSLGTRIHRKHQTKLIISCPVDYSTHYADAYTNFAAAAIESGYIDKVLQHVFEFGSLNRERDSWPSWVPSWNKKKTWYDAKDVFTYRVRRPKLLSIILDYHIVDQCVGRELFTTDDVRTINLYGTKALHLRGCINRIGDVQLSADDMDAITHLQITLSRRCIDQQSLICRYKVAWLVTNALLRMPGVLARKRLKQNDFFTLRTSKTCNSGLWIAVKKILGLPWDELTEDEFDLKEDVFLREARRILKDLYVFSYEYDGSPEFGIAMAEVRAGDFVLRTTGAITLDTEVGSLTPSLSGLIIRPCHQSTSTGHGTFRLVGWCIDYYPDVTEPEIVDVVLV